MQINVRLLSGGGYVTIADSAAGDLIDFRGPPVMSTDEYIVGGYGGGTKRVFNMGNAMWVLQLPIRKFYASAALARKAIADLGAVFGAGAMDVQLLDDGVSTYLPAASVGTFAPDSSDGQRGVAVFFTLKFTAASYTTTPP